MQTRTLVFATLLLACVAPSQAVETKNAIAKVIEMISDLETKTIEEGKKAQATYEEFAEFCEEKSKEMNHEIKTATAEKEDLEAAIDKAAADISKNTAKIEELTAEISTA